MITVTNTRENTGMTTQKTASELSRQASALGAQAAAGDRVEITNQGREYVTIMSTTEARRLDYAAAALQGFLRLAARGADCWEYQERAEDLAELVRCGALRLPPDVEQEVRQAPIPA